MQGEHSLIINALIALNRWSLHIFHVELTPFRLLMVDVCDKVCRSKSIHAIHSFYFKFHIPYYHACLQRRIGDDALFTNGSVQLMLSPFSIENKCTKVYLPPHSSRRDKNVHVIQSIFSLCDIFKGIIHRTLTQSISNFSLHKILHHRTLLNCGITMSCSEQWVYL